MAKIILPRQVNVLLDQILDKSDNAQFLATEGLFRVAGNKTEIKRAFKAFLSSPKDFELVKQQAILASPHNVIGLLIDTISSTEKPVKFSKEALNVLNDCIAKMAKGAPANPIDEMMDTLVQADQLEEAKLFHNLFYLAHRVVQYSNNNQTHADMIASVLINAKFLDFAGISPDESATSTKYFALLGKIPQYTMPLIEHSPRYQARFKELTPKAVIEPLPKVEPIKAPIVERSKVETIKAPIVERPKVEAIEISKVEIPKVELPKMEPVEAPKAESHHVPSLDEISSTFVTEWSAAKKATKQDWLALISDFKVMGNFIKNVSTKVNELQSRLRTSNKNDGGTKPKPKP